MALELLAVELSGPDPLQERVPFPSSEEQGLLARVLAVPNGHAPRLHGHLDTSRLDALEGEERSPEVRGLHRELLALEHFQVLLKRVCRPRPPWSYKYKL